VGFATYVGHFVPLDAGGIKAVAIASIVVLTALNCLGVRLGATTQDVLRFIKVALVGVLIGCVVVEALVVGARQRQAEVR